VQAIRPPAVGRKNWLHIGDDGRLRPAAVLLSLAASVRRHGVNPWAYYRHVLTELPSRPEQADLIYFPAVGFARAPWASIPLVSGAAAGV